MVKECLCIGGYNGEEHALWCPAFIKEMKQSDPFLQHGNCVNRLMAEYEKHKQLIIALDFDDTIYDFHKKGNSHDDVINIVKECQKLGFHIVIFTASPKERYDFIRKHCESVGIIPTAINENAIPGMAFGHNGKIYFNLLLDDRAGLHEAYNILRGVLNKIYFERAMTGKL